jgi:tRNA A37 threonylcarbamoyladenosine modification protein TsaB
LAELLKKPLVGISSLAALARPHAQALAQMDQKTLLIAATDACKGELFSLVGVPTSVKDCVCKAEGDLPGIWKRGVEETHSSAEDLTKSIQKRLKVLGPKWSWMVVGEGRLLYPEFWKKLPRSREQKPFFAQTLQGRAVAELAWEAVQAGVMAQGSQIYPRYLRESDAERKLKAGLLPSAPRRAGSA